jgi:hypothetical protein
MVLNMLCFGVLAMQLQALQAQRDAFALQAAVGLSQDLWERSLTLGHTGERGVQNAALNAAQCWER